MNPYFKETVETKEISGPEKSKLSTAFENEKKSSGNAGPGVISCWRSKCG